MLQHHPEIFKVESAGHTDNAGDKAENQALSKKRAAPSSSTSRARASTAGAFPAGYGPDKPIADNKSAAGR